MFFSFFFCPFSVCITVLCFFVSAYVFCFFIRFMAVKIWCRFDNLKLCWSFVILVCMAG